MTEAVTNYREIADANGRIYRVGETDREILGRSRSYMVWLPWVAMMAVSVFEYGFGAASDILQQGHGWSLSATFWLMAIWAMFQAAIAFPAGRLRETGKLKARTAMFLGGAFSGLGFIVVASTDNLVLAFAGFSVLGGIGVGLVYATCINMVGKWYPDRRGARTGFVNGGFAYGAVPFIFIFTYYFHVSNYSIVLNLVGLFMIAVVAVCAAFFKDPPKNWWPADVDPLHWAESKAGAKSLLKNPPAVRQFTTWEALKSGQLGLMWLAQALTTGVSLFGIGFMVPFAQHLGFGPLVAASSAGVLSIVNGTGRAITGVVSDKLGRKNTLVLVLLIQALSMLGLLYTGNAHNEPLFLIFAFLVGFGGGAFYPMFAAIVPDYFGENNNASNYGLVYSSKLVGSILGLGFSSSMIDSLGYTSSYWIAAGFGLVATLVALGLRQPGRRRQPAGATSGRLLFRNRVADKPAVAEDAAVGSNLTN